MHKQVPAMPNRLVTFRARIPGAVEASLVLHEGHRRSARRRLGGKQPCAAADYGEDAASRPGKPGVVKINLDNLEGALQATDRIDAGSTRAQRVQNLNRIIVNRLAAVLPSVGGRSRRRQSQSVLQLLGQGL